MVFLVVVMPKNREGNRLGNVFFTPDTVAKLRLRKNDAILIRRRTHLGKNESLPP
jgi:hypothetical protein